VVVKRGVLGLPRRSVVFDSALAVAMLALSISIGPSIPSDLEGWRAALALCFIAVHTLCLVGRRIWPVAVLATNAVSGLAISVLDFHLVVLGPASLIALYTVASTRGRKVSMPAAALTIAGATVALRISTPEADVSTFVGNAVVLFVAWFLGDSAHSRRAYMAALEQRTAELERAREELARTRVAEERLRIARELHDVVGHSLSTIAVQSGVGAHLIESQPAQAKRSLEAIETASKSALQDIRRVLGILREGGAEQALDPAPGFGALPALVRQATESGLVVDFDGLDDGSDLPVSLQLTAYRIVQEALTNVIKHSNGGRARVSVVRSSRDLRIEVTDDGVSNSTAPSFGHGLMGMRERVAMHGGELEVGSLPEGGFRVGASLPLGRDA
jgi:signal transduction histidine kinase